MAMSCYDNPCHFSLILSESVTDLSILNLRTVTLSSPNRFTFVYHSYFFFTLWYPVQLYLLLLVNWFTYGLSIVFLIIPVNTFLFIFLYSNILHNLYAMFLYILYESPYLCNSRFSYRRLYCLPNFSPLVYHSSSRFCVYLLLLSPRSFQKSDYFLRFSNI